MSAARRARAAFTLIEALVAVALTAIGVVAVMGGMGALTRVEKERMQRLAIDKYHELSATGDRTTSNGDFSDRNETRYVWTAAVEPTGVENLDQLTVTVRLTGADREREEVVSGLVYQAPAPQEPQPAVGGDLLP
jgi:Tfp pilus assembly protein PilV